MNKYCCLIKPVVKRSESFAQSRCDLFVDNVSGSSNAVIFNLQEEYQHTKGNVAIQGIGGSIAAPVCGAPIASEVILNYSRFNIK